MKKLTDAQIAKKHGITRQAVGVRRASGWTEEEILNNQRQERVRGAYRTEITRHLGMTVAEAAEIEGVGTAEIYRRWRRARLGLDADKPILRKLAEKEAKEHAIHENDY